MHPDEEPGDEDLLDFAAVHTVLNSGDVYAVEPEQVPDQALITGLMKEKACIPTRSGMQQPDKAYFPNATFFPDLPVVTLPKGSQVKGNLEKVLEALGVRKHVDLQIIFDRFVSYISL